MAWAIQWDGHNANSIIILYEEKKLQASLWAYIYHTLIHKQSASIPVNVPWKFRNSFFTNRIFTIVSRSIGQISTEVNNWSRSVTFIYHVARTEGWCHCKQELSTIIATFLLLLIPWNELLLLLNTLMTQLFSDFYFFNSTFQEPSFFLLFIFPST